MYKITFIDIEGTARDVDAAEGISVMEAATQNLIPSIEADSGGACACAIWHVYVDPSWLDHLPPVSAMEHSMLEHSIERDGSSRLSCPIKIKPELHGMVVRTPAAQHGLGCPFANFSGETRDRGNRLRHFPNWRIQ